VVVWVDDKTGLPCQAKRNHSGAWCGYVGVPEGHRAYGRGYEDVPAVVHGGLTFAGHWSDEGPWWLGFDCGHFMDRMPAMDARLREIHKTRPDFPDMPEVMGWRQEYRDLAYVVDEVTQLAAQLAALK
jgi:hypothetical protein